MNTNRLKLLVSMMILLQQQGTIGMNGRHPTLAANGRFVLAGIGGVRSMFPKKNEMRISPCQSVEEIELKSAIKSMRDQAYELYMDVQLDKSCRDIIYSTLLTEFQLPVEKERVRKIFHYAECRLCKYCKNDLTHQNNYNDAGSVSVPMFVKALLKTRNYFIDYLGLIYICMLREFFRKDDVLSEIESTHPGAVFQENILNDIGSSASEIDQSIWSFEGSVEFEKCKSFPSETRSLPPKMVKQLCEMYSGVWLKKDRNSMSTLFRILLKPDTNLEQRAVIVASFHHAEALMGNGEKISMPDFIHNLWSYRGSFTEEIDKILKSALNELNRTASLIYQAKPTSFSLMKIW